jgi:hypothetical protein
MLIEPAKESVGKKHFSAQTLWGIYADVRSADSQNLKPTPLRGEV